MPRLVDDIRNGLRLRIPIGFKQVVTSNSAGSHYRGDVVFAAQDQESDDSGENHDIEKNMECRLVLDSN